MMHKNILNFCLIDYFNYILVPNKSLFFFKGMRGVMVIKMPSFYFFKETSVALHLVFAEKRFYAYFMHFFYSRYAGAFFYFKLKLRGLGYRIKAIAINFFRFFIGTTNLYFFHAPSDVLVRVRRRRMLLVSMDLGKLNLLIAHLLLLKKLIPYGLRGLFFPKQIILLKPGKKKF